METNLTEIMNAMLIEKESSAATCKAYRSVLGVWIDDTDVTKLEGVKRTVIIEWKNTLLHHRNLSVNTWNTYWRTMHALFTYSRILCNWDFGNELEGIKQLPTHQANKKTVDLLLIRDACRWLIENEDVYQNDRNRTKHAMAKRVGIRPAWFWVTLIKFLFLTGMRRRQLCGLEWYDIDFKRRSIVLRAKHSKTKREWLIPLPDSTVKPLRELQERTEEILQRRIRKDDQVFNVTLFNNRFFGDRMTEEQVSGFFRRLQSRSGITISTHRLRHTMATKAANSGGSLKALQNTLGHTDIKTTMAYVRADLGDMRNLIGDLENIF